MTDLSELKFFATHPHECSYLDDKEATTVFIDPKASIDRKLYSSLSDFGFRRSGQHVYKPHCETCNACIPIRVKVSDFQFSRSQKRCLKYNDDLHFEQVETIANDECFALYEHYIATRHADGDMYPATFDQFHNFLGEAFGTTRYLTFRIENKLACVAVSDELERGLSAIYTFFDTALPNKRSLGRFAVLKQIELAQAMSLDYVYLGYWIKHCQKMSYKTDYRPFEVFINNQWVTVK